MAPSRKRKVTDIVGSISGVADPVPVSVPLPVPDENGETNVNSEFHLHVDNDEEEEPEMSGDTELTEEASIPSGHTNDLALPFASSPSPAQGPETSQDEDTLEEQQQLQPSTSRSGGDDDPERPESKFKFKQRVFAKDLQTGMLYEGIVRRVMYGVQYQRQVKLITEMSEEEITAVLEMEPQPTWWYFIHYSGWNVKWDRWVEQNNLYEPTESTKHLAKRFHDELNLIKSEMRANKSTGKPSPAQIAMELENRMMVLEREHRIEERRRELNKQGQVMKQEEQKAMMDEEAEAEEAAKNPNKPRIKWTKANLAKEFALRERHLQGRRSQASSELLVLPFALKKIMVEDWEIITQCNMVANIPVAVSIQDALNQYKESKIKSFIDQLNGKQREDTSLAPATALPNNLSDKDREREREYREMVEGVCLFFDQALPERLLYHPEQVQYQAILSNGNEKRPCEIYGCEFLLRMFLRIPAILMQQLPEKESKSILAKLNDLVRFLQKNQVALFTQSYRRLNEVEIVMTSNS